MPNRSDGDLADAIEAAIRKAVAPLSEDIVKLATKTEWGFKEVHVRQDTTNGNLHKHDTRIKLAEAWMRAQDIKAAHDAGVQDGGKALRKRDLAVLGVLIAIVGALAPTAVSLLTSL